MNLLDLFAVPLRRTPEKVALRFREPSGEETVHTYGRLFAAADALAAGLAASGVGKGDRVAFFLGNRPEFAVAYLAAAAEKKKNGPSYMSTQSAAANPFAKKT